MIAAAITLRGHVLTSSRGGRAVVTLNYTTSVPVGRTVAEVQDLFGEDGADEVAVARLVELRGWVRDEDQS